MADDNNTNTEPTVGTDTVSTDEDTGKGVGIGEIAGGVVAGAAAAPLTAKVLAGGIQKKNQAGLTATRKALNDALLKEPVLPLSSLLELVHKEGALAHLENIKGDISEKAYEHMKRVLNSEALAGTVHHPEDITRIANQVNEQFKEFANWGGYSGANENNTVEKLLTEASAARTVAPAVVQSEAVIGARKAFEEASTRAKRFNKAITNPAQEVETLAKDAKEVSMFKKLGPVWKEGGKMQKAGLILIPVGIAVAIGSIIHWARGSHTEQLEVDRSAPAPEMSKA